MNICKILIGMTAVTALFAEDSAAVDRSKLLDHLRKSADGFEHSIKGLTPEQWKFKPGPDVWSVGECAEHIVFTENLFATWSLTRFFRVRRKQTAQAGLRTTRSRP